MKLLKYDNIGQTVPLFGSAHTTKGSRNAPYVPDFTALLGHQIAVEERNPVKASSV